MDVFLSLYVLPGEGGTGASMLPFLVAAENGESAVEITDSFVEAVESLANPMVEDHILEAARTEMEVLRGTIVLVECQDDIAMISDCLREHNPHFEAAMPDMIGSLFTVEVTLNSGFSQRAVTSLRNQMSGHYVLSNLSVELI